MNILKRLFRKRPRYKHDCDNCIYVGRIDEYDIYYCSHSTSVVARYSDEGPDYTSLMYDGIKIQHKDSVWQYLTKDNILYKAKQLVDESGIIKK
jgi:hypothetical protein